MENLSLFDETPVARLQRLLKQHIPKAEERVNRAYRQWNLVIRDYLRSETALRLTIGKDTQSVPIKIEDGIPLSVKKHIEEFAEYLELLLLLPTLEKTIDGLNAILGNHALISKEIFNNQPLAQYEDVSKTLAFTQTTVIDLKKIEFLKKLGLIEQDIFGAYFFYEKQISIYWIPIALTSALLGVSVESLTVVTLAHEIAHAYTHLGKDIDKQQWNTKAFQITSLEITEGLAQFYTSVICEKLSVRYPDALKTYEKLLEIQSGQYKVHTEWAKDEKSRGEIIRVSMIKCRAKKINKYEDFKQLLANETLALKTSH